MEVDVCNFFQINLALVYFISCPTRRLFRRSLLKFSGQRLNFERTVCLEICKCSLIYGKNDHFLPCSDSFLQVGVLSRDLEAQDEANYSGAIPHRKFFLKLPNSAQNEMCNYVLIRQAKLA